MTARTEMSSAARVATGNLSEITAAFQWQLFFYWQRGDITGPLESDRQRDIGQGLG